MISDSTLSGSDDEAAGSMSRARRTLHPMGAGRERAWAGVSVAVPIVGAFAAAQFLSWALRETGAVRAWLFVASGASLAAAVVIAVVAKVREVKRGATIGDAQRRQLVQLRDRLMPLASTTADMARHPIELREPYLEGVAKVAAGALARTVERHVDRPRAVVYLLDADAVPPLMRSIGHSGRGERPHPFVAGTARGDSALDFIDGRRAVFFPDLDRRRPEGYDGTMSDYRTFVSVPIWTETGVYGMVTLDAPAPGSLDEGDVALTELVAELMSIPFEVGQDQDTPDPAAGEGSAP